MRRVLKSLRPPPDISFSAGELASASGIDVAPLLRIEQRAGVLAVQCRTFDEFLDRYAADVKKVTPADVQRVAQKYLGILRTVIVQPQ